MDRVESKKSVSGITVEIPRDKVDEMKTLQFKKNRTKEEESRLVELYRETMEGVLNGLEDAGINEF